MDTQAIDRSWVKHCFVIDDDGVRRTIDDSVRRHVDNDRIRAQCRELAQRGVDLQRSVTSRPADVYRLATWAADVVRRSNFSARWLSIGDEPGAALSRAEIVAILDRIALEEAVAAVERERARRVARGRCDGRRTRRPARHA
jgi:hypothetical protein